MAKIYIIALMLLSEITFSGDESFKQINKIDATSIPLEVWQTIFRYLHKKEDVGAIFASKDFYNISRISITYLRIGRAFNEESPTKCVELFPKIRELNLFTCLELRDEDFFNIRNLTNLLKLDLAYCNNITGEGFRNFNALAKLESLNLDSCMKIKTENLKFISLLSNLKTLKLSNCTNDGLKYLTVNIKKLSISNCNTPYNRDPLFTNEGVKYLSNLTNLCELEIYNCCGLTEDILDFLKTLTKIKKLPTMEQLYPGFAM